MWGHVCPAEGTARAKALKKVLVSCAQLKKREAVLQVNEPERLRRVGVPHVEEVVSLPLLIPQGTGISCSILQLAFYSSCC